MKTIAALLICGVDYKSAMNLEYGEANLLIEEWVKLKGGDKSDGNDRTIYVAE